MNYTIQKNKIIINNKDEFKPKNIIECGQIFCYKKEDDITYIVYSADKMAKVKEYETYVEIETDNTEYFVNYFDLNTNYTELKNKFINDYPYLTKAINYGTGIRILKQEPFETIIGFIISANNNIKRIQKIMFAIRQTFGKNMGEYYTFPTAQELSVATEQDFNNMGAGYRAKYLVEATKQLANIDYGILRKMSTDELNKYLLTIMGVGQKVADCIMLFAFSKGDVFPVDTWIEKVYCSYFEEEHNRTTIRKNLLNKFGNNSGYIQQYLFYSQRENS